MSPLDGKVAIVTGASSGIGRAVAQELARQGGATVCASRSPDALDRAVAEITASGGAAVGVPTDVSSDADVQRLVASALDEYGRLDLAFNNAGIPGHGTVTDIAVEDFDRIVAVNLRGVFLCLDE